MSTTTITRSGPPAPTTESERYLFALLDSEAILMTALDALTARMAHADAFETDDIRISKAEIQSDLLKLQARRAAFSSRSVVFKSFSDAQVAHLREILQRLQGFTAAREKASAIVDAVGAALATWNQVPKPATDVDVNDAVRETIR